MQAAVSNATLLDTSNELSESLRMPGAWIEDSVFELTDAVVAPAFETTTSEYLNSPTTVTVLTLYNKVLDLPEPPLLLPSISLHSMNAQASSVTSIPEQSTATPIHLIQQSENPQPEEEVECDASSWVRNNTAVSWEEHVSKITTEVKAIGNISLTAYQGMLSRLERLQAQFASFCAVDTRPADNAPETDTLPTSPKEHSDVAVKSRLFVHICFILNS